MSELEDKVGDKKSIHSSSVLKQSIHLPLHSQKDLNLQYECVVEAKERLQLTDEWLMSEL